MKYKWVRDNMDINETRDSAQTISVHNSGVLEYDFYKYARDFNEAANVIIRYLIQDASSRGDIAKLDLWYFALVYLYRQSIELLIKANLFKLEKDDDKRKVLLSEVSHDVKKAFDELVKLSDVNVNNENVEWLGAFLDDISKIDRESDMFRYPFNNKMKTLFNRQTHVYLPATYYNMNRAFVLLKEFYCKNNFSEEKCRPEEFYEPKLIVEGENYYFQSVVGYKYAEGTYFPYTTSYMECGEFLKNVIDNTGKTNLFMPMCYLYRNAVELALKKIIVESSKLDRDSALKIIRKKKHSFVGLWNKISDELRTHVYDENDKTIDNVEKYINNFHQYDNSSDKFRYPCNKDLKVYFFTPTELDIDNVSDCFIELIHFLDGADSMLLYEKEYEAEMQAEMQAEFESEIAKDYDLNYR